MIIVESRRKKSATLEKKYPGAVHADVTSNSDSDSLRKLSPFYPHYDIPVPFSPGVTAACVEAVWQGLKVFESEGVDVNMFGNDTMKNIKRTVRRFGRCLGHQKGVDGNEDELLDYLEARKHIYIPAYKWVLENKVSEIIEKLRKADEKGRTILLLDYNTNEDIDNPKKPLSHAALIKAYVLGEYPFGERKADSEDASESNVEDDGQMLLF